MKLHRARRWSFSRISMELHVAANVSPPPGKPGASVDYSVWGCGWGFQIVYRQSGGLRLLGLYECSFVEPELILPNVV